MAEERSIIRDRDLMSDGWEEGRLTLKLMECIALLSEMRLCLVRCESEKVVTKRRLTKLDARANLAVV